ncbi:MAG: glycosyltransferase 87 family protein [Euryarchaeota archaeon]|nr:glycosyltransferase 87 family protein [Euryarchaeota archaeon]
MKETPKDHHIEKNGSKLNRKANDWIDHSSFKQKTLVLIIITVLIYGSGITYIWTFTDTSTSDFDVHLYQSRTRTILDGGLLYKDVHTETPPLINYVMIPAQVLGGADNPWIYALYASFFAFLLAMLMYMSFRKYDDKKAFLIGFLILLCPFMIDKTIVSDDDSIVAFFFMLGAVSMLFEKPRTSAAMIAIGIWTKMWAILLLPVQFLRLRTWKERIDTIVIVAIVTVIIAIPYVILCYDEFLDFLSYYFLIKANRTMEGFSMTVFLERGGMGIPKALMLGIVLISLLVAVLYSHHKGWGAWKSATFVMIVFIIVYPKMHMGYYIMPMALLMVWAVDDWRILVRLFVSFLPLHYAAVCQTGKAEFLGDWFGNSNIWLFGFVLALIGTLLFVDAMRLAFKRELLSDRENAMVPE